MWTEGMITVMVGITGIILTVILIIFVLIKSGKKEKAQLKNKSDISATESLPVEDEEILDETELLDAKTELIDEKVEDTILLENAIDETELLNYEIVKK